MKHSLARAMTLAALALSLALTFAAFAPGLYAQAQTEKKKNNTHYIEKLEYMFDYIQNHYVDEVDPTQLYEGALKGLFESLNDPHSVYLTVGDMEDYTDTTVGEFGGVGLYISKSANILVNENGNNTKLKETFRTQYAPYVEVISPIEGTPAYRAGVSAGDFIIAIDTESTDSLSMDEVLSRLRGAPGTNVTMTIARKGGLKFDVKVTRAIIEVPVLRSAMIPGGTGYIRVIKWTPFTRDRVAEVLKDFRRKDLNSLILDVRGNPGGLLSAAVEVSNLFLTRGPIVSTQSRIEKESEIFYADRKTALEEDIPVAVLIDEGSASASEIFAGAMKDSDRAILVGAASFGKGSVQQIHAFGEGGFKMTTARYYTPKGVNIDKVGIVPHVLVTEEEFSDEEQEDLQILFEENRIPFFVEQNPKADARQVAQFIEKLQKEGISLKTRVLKRMIHREVNRTLSEPPIYDLEYDTALQKAMELITPKAQQSILWSKTPDISDLEPSTPILGG